MIDRFFYTLFSGIDRLCEAVANKIAGPRCQCKKKKKWNKILTLDVKIVAAHVIVLMKDIQIGVDHLVNLAENVIV